MKRFILSLAVALPTLTMAQHPLPEISYLQIYDIETYTAKVIKEFPFTVEAPNWSPDGKWLLLNKDGRLYRMAADGSTDLQEIPTGSITRCNNDHVISADGKWIGLSSNSNQQAYNSYVYVVPVEGGEPRQITPIGPSYLHGISPDGKTVAYCAFRESHFIWQMIDYIEPLYEFKDKIFHVHCKDIKLDVEKLRRCGIMAYPLDYMHPKLPGLGDVNWGKYISALTDIGYDSFTCIEVEDRAFERSRERVLDSLRLSKRYLEQFVI